MTRELHTDDVAFVNSIVSVKQKLAAKTVKYQSTNLSSTRSTDLLTEF